ncbi:MAG: hypothetical protein OXI96_10715 [Acidimicrobiaceae bacterium]|nr:hypothetical protein [Acidimicrobiaceae bacterium]
MAYSFISSGQLQIAAALAFHLPGARLDLSNGEGLKCSIGPLTDPQCILHPAEFRDLIVTTGGTMKSLMSLSKGYLPDNSNNDNDSNSKENGQSSVPSISLTMAMPGVHHLGGGVYRIINDEATSYAFVTLLPADVVDAILSTMKTKYPLEYGLNATSSSDSNSEPAHDDNVIAVSLIYDEGLKVTTTIMSSSNKCDTICQEVANLASTACLVTEMEYSVHNVDES